MAQQSPPAETSVTISGKTIRINYSGAIHARGAKCFGGLEPPTDTPSGAPERMKLRRYTPTPISTSEAVSVPKRAITRFSFTWIPSQWQLVVSKATGEWGLDYDQRHDLGRVKMDMSKPPRPIETYKMTALQPGRQQRQAATGGKTPPAEVPITVK